jgi:hypothetical protein
MKELISSYLSVRHEPHRKRYIQQLDFCGSVRCDGNVFTEPLPGNGRDTYRQTEGRDL